MSGVRINMEFHAPGQYHVDISCLGPDGVIEYQKSDRVSVYYVRRELRAMSTADRERYLDAFKLLGEAGRLGLITWKVTSPSISLHPLHLPRSP